MKLQCVEGGKGNSWNLYGDFWEFPLGIYSMVFSSIGNLSHGSFSWDFSCFFSYRSFGEFRGFFEVLRTFDGICL